MIAMTVCVPASAAAAGPAGRLVALGIDECARDINDLGVVVTDTKLYWLGKTRALPKGVEQATHINNRGQIAGSAGRFAVLWDGKKLVTLKGAVLGEEYSYITGLNELGDAVGNSGSFGGETHAFLYRNGVTTALARLGPSTSANGLNDNGQIVGATTVDGVQRTFRWEKDGSIVRLPSLDDGTGHAMAIDINNAGVATGYSYGSQSFGGLRAVTWSKSGQISSIDVPDSVFGLGSDINNRGMVVGQTSPAAQSGLVWQKSPTVVAPLTRGAVTVLNAVNNFGWAVGCEYGAESSSATMWRPNR
jgi:probable HAF family extracellular repeat protein